VQWRTFARACIAGRIGGEGDFSRICLQDQVARSPIQLVEGLYELPYNLFYRINEEVREFDNAKFVEVLRHLEQVPQLLPPCRMPQTTTNV